MKKRTTIILIACAAMMASSPGVVRAEVDISASIQINAPTDFYQPLEPYGTWVDVSSYGHCWRPREVAVDWQPYTMGHWEWTDAGWYWASDEPWGWACFHYGSWYHDASYGWVWIPGTDWAPAWVTWRYSDAYIGWAPCGPGLSVLAPSFFTFCDVHRFNDHFRSRRDFVVNNTTIINRTKVVKSFNRQTVDFNGHQRTIFANRGPGVEPIQRATGHNFTARPVRDVIRETPHPQNVRGNNGQGRDQRPVEQRQTPSPTGRDQQRSYQQPDNHRDQTPPIYQTPQQQQQNRTRELQQQQQQRQQELRTPQPPTPAPERQRKEVPTPQHPATPAPQTPAERPLPPTGRNEVRPAQPAQPERREVTPPVQERHEVPTPAPEQHKEVPAPPQHSATPERPLPPTGRDEVRPQPERPAAPHAPVVRPAPPVRETPPAAVPGADGHGRDGRDQRDGNHP